MGSSAATVEVLTAEVRVLMVGNRQVTMSVYKQLDHVPAGELATFGRVNFTDRDKPTGRVRVVGRHIPTGALARSHLDEPLPPAYWNRAGDVPGSDNWFRVGPARSHLGNYVDPSVWIRDRGSRTDDMRYTCGVHYMSYSDIPLRPSSALIRSRGQYRYIVTIPHNAPTDMKLKPGGWDYIDTSAQFAAEEVASEALLLIISHVYEYESWKELPLIVLAGLR